MNETVITVPLSHHSYSVHIGAGLLASGRAADIVVECAAASRVCLVTHPGLRVRYADPLAAGLQARGLDAAVVTIPAGERYKQLRMVARLYDDFLAAGLDRKSLIVAVGGGVLGDIVGFAAATYLRGVPFVQIPTTLLAQVDASVGGKTGVDLPQGKNLVGAFHQPSAVIVDPDTLRSLPLRELRSGLSEVIKYGIIFDSGFLETVCENLPDLLRRDAAPLTAAIARSVEIKAYVVGQDETEQGLRAILNFGHTLGHALESVTAYRRYRHGEAVAIGMVSACLIGEQIGVTPPAVTARVREACRAAGLPVAFPTDIDPLAILEAAQRDKKSVGGRLRFVLARGIGDVFLSADVPIDAVRAAISGRQGRADV